MLKTLHDSIVQTAKSAEEPPKKSRWSLFSDDSKDDQPLTIESPFEVNSPHQPQSLRIYLVRLQLQGGVLLLKGTALLHLHSRSYTASLTGSSFCCLE